MDYNTSRGHLELPEYGREVQKMVEHALTISDRAERQRCAETIVRTMQRVSPHVFKDENSWNKYWDHLAVMSDFKLDIDYPIDIEKAKKIHTMPNRVEYVKGDDRVCHYGVLLFELFDSLRRMPEGEERDCLVQRTANIMYRCLEEYSPNSADEAKVASDLAYYTGGVIQVGADELNIQDPAQSRRAAEKKKKRK